MGGVLVEIIHHPIHAFFGFSILKEAKGTMSCNIW